MKHRQIGDGAQWSFSFFRNKVMIVAFMLRDQNDQPELASLRRRD
jgi:hypothetical protein